MSRPKPCPAPDPAAQPPALRGLRLPAQQCVLRSWRASDRRALISAANNAEVAHFLRDRFPQPYTEADARIFLAAAGRATEAGAVLAIEVDGRAAGGIGIEIGEAEERHNGELGYWLGRDYWGRGIMSGAVAAFVPWAMNAYSLARVGAGVYAGNRASMRVLEHNGFRREGRRRLAVCKHGQLLDVLLYGLINPEMHT